jgi:signal transduction histidine kinase
VSDIYLLKDELTALPECKNREGLTESIVSIEGNINYINKIVSELQDYARQISPDYVIVNFSDVIVRVFETVRLPDSIELSIKVNNLDKLRTDPMLLQRAITNLVNNAIQAMPDGGKLEIAGYPSNNEVVIIVSDTGLGIPEEIKPKLFSPMMTTKSKGQGFGLAVSKRLIEALTGTITFESQVGKGTKFIIELPTS